MTKRSSLLCWTLVGPALAGLLLATCPASAGESDSTATDLQEVVVTAQKREERLQDVPIAISVVTPALLKSTNARNLSELQGAIPSVYFAGNSGGGRTYVTLRGATGLALNSGDEPVAIYMDDVYLARGVTIGMTDLLDIAAIEIVRGPQGTLQGRNATAGAILIRSADPTPNLQSRISLSGAHPEEYRAQADVSGPLGGDFAGRVAAGYVNELGWAKNTVTGRQIGGAKSAQVRGTVTYTPADGFNARLVMDYSNIENEPAIVRWAATNFSPLPTGALVPAGTATPQIPLSPADQDRIKNHNEFALYPDTSTRVETGGLAARVSYSWTSVNFVSITGFRNTDVRGINNSGGLGRLDRFGYNRNHEKSQQWSEELRLQSSAADRFAWILGLYAFTESQSYDDPIYNLSFTLPTNIVTQYSGYLNTRSLAAFADGTFHVSDKVSVIGGLRETDDRKSINGWITTSNLTTGAPPATLPYAPPTVDWHDLSYRGKLVYKPTDDLMLFAGYGRGFRSGGYNPFAVQPPYAPETNKSVEGGAKGEFLHRRLGVSLSVYRNLYDNLQLRAGVPTGGAIITNAADSRIRGVELELTAQPTDTLRIVANGAYTDAVFTSFPRARDIFDHQVDASGNKLPRTPKWQYFLSAAQDFKLGGGSMLTAEANYRWRDRVYFYFTNQDLPTWQDGPGRELGAQVSWQDPSEHWRLAVYGTNLTNSRIINTAAVTFSYPQVGFNKPRVVGASIEWRF
ncbi:MAG: hypothetical protein JWO04_2723 [Gammaproteobacteria bacterium]|nr:hypothetical protein [Gammaproteobacteria bacterium]